jgi:Xaa-Pro dipeptidase
MGDFKVETSHSETSDIHSVRLEKLVNSLKENKIDAVAIVPGPNMLYITGLHFHTSERPVVAIITRSSKAILILPELEAAKADKWEAVEGVLTYGEDPSLWSDTFRIALRSLKPRPQVLGIEFRNTRLFEYQMIKESLTDCEIIPSDAILYKLREIKDGVEIAQTQKAIDIAQEALAETLTTIDFGWSEKEISALLTGNILKQGADAEFPFQPIVQIGANSAVPHGFVTEKRLGEKDILLIDWGARVNGYVSDITRTFKLGEIDSRLINAANIVQEANQAALSLVKPGVPASQIDQAARDVIKSAGFGEYFIHRTGHGIGLEGHEQPYIRSDNHAPLKEGMLFTIEPGIYIPGLGGIRIEDDVLVTSVSGQRMTTLPQEVSTLGEK